MWKDYSAGYIRKNRASSVSIMVAAFISTLFLSLLCCLFYNFWRYEIEQITLEEGDWQGRIVGAFDEDDLAVIRQFVNVERAEGNREQAVDIWFYNSRTIYQDMPRIARRLAVGEEAVSYHELLLSRYLIHDPQDEEPPLLMAFYVFVLVIVSLSLILIIRNSFAVSMNARIHQFGIFSSIGATPGQIRICLLQEAFFLCLAPVLLGILSGILLSAGILQVMNVLAADVAGRHTAVFQYHWTVLGITVLASVVTVLVSAWLPARKLSKLTPLEAIRGNDGLQLKRKRCSPVLALLFGMEGELAGNALKAQRRALRTSSLSLTLSFLGFTMMLCFFTLSGISTRYTYFDRYQDVWDVMITVQDTEIGTFEMTEKLKELEGVSDCIVYQKASATVFVPQEWQSEELAALGGLEALAGALAAEDGTLQGRTPVVILDDESFLKYCEQIRITPRLDGTVILNQIWDSIHSNFRYPEYIPFVREDRDTVILQGAGPDGAVTELPVIGYTRQAPILREEYDDYALVQFIPLSLWREMAGQCGTAEADICIRILARERTALDSLNRLEADAAQLLSRQYKLESENRLKERITNDQMLHGYILLLGGLCSLLAMIGIANVFSNTLGFLRQRKREFARYMSVGLTPAGLRKLFCIEAMVIAGRPILITLPLTALFVCFAVSASHLKMGEFLAEAPVVPGAVFIMAVGGFVALAYYIGGKQVLRYNLAEALRDDTLG